MSALLHIAVLLIILKVFDPSLFWIFLISGVFLCDFFLYREVTTRLNREIIRRVREVEKNVFRRSR